MFHILIIFTHPCSFILVFFALELSPFFSGILNFGTFGLLHYFNEFSAVSMRRDFEWLLFYLPLSACIAVFN